METGVQDNAHLLSLLREQGWSVERRAAQDSWAGKPPGSTEIKFWHGSVFDHGTQDNVIAQLRRLGFETPVERVRNGKAGIVPTETATPVEAPPAPKEPETPKPKVTLTQAQERVLQAVKQSAPKGTTRGELAKSVGMEVAQVSVHMRALKATGLVRTTGATTSLRYYPTSVDVPVEVNSNGNGHRAGPVRVRHQRPQSMQVRVAEIFKSIDKGLAMLTEGVALLHEELEPLASAHDDATTKLKKVQDQMDNLIGAVTD